MPVHGKSSYYYQRAVMKQSDKYAEIRIRIKIIFQENRNCYGYRRIHGELKNRNYCFRKIVRRIMKEEHLTVPTKRMKNTAHIKVKSHRR